MWAILIMPGAFAAFGIIDIISRLLKKKRCTEMVYATVCEEE